MRGRIIPGRAVGERPELPRTGWRMGDAVTSDRWWDWRFDRARDARDSTGQLQGNGERLPRRDRDDRALRVGPARGRRDAGRGRWRQGRATGRAIADRRHPRAGWLLRDNGRLPTDHGGSAVDRRSARSPVVPQPG